MRVSYVESIDGGTGWFVELNNGAAWRLTGCAAEDDRLCVWDAKVMGNGMGRSFADVGGRMVPIPERVMARAR